LDDFRLPGLSRGDEKFPLTRGYAKDFETGTIHEVEIDTKGFVKTTTKPNRRVLRGLATKCPDKGLLYNYGYENHYQNINWAVNAYMDEETLIEAVMGMYHDLYPDESNIFAKTLVKLGINGWIHSFDDRKHYVVLNPNKIKIIGHEKV
jgi:hypothetical protein